MGHVGPLCPDRPVSCPAFGIDQWFQWGPQGRGHHVSKCVPEPIFRDRLLSQAPSSLLGAKIHSVSRAAYTSLNAPIDFSRLSPSGWYFCSPYARARMCRKNDASYPLISLKSASRTSDDEGEITVAKTAGAVLAGSSSDSEVRAA